MGKIQIKKVVPEDMNWVNNTYKNVDFVLSNFETEYIALAEIDGVKCGLGRVVTIDKNNLELGGMYVSDTFRGLGVAEKIINHLITNINDNKRIWCLPFEHLRGFYVKFGFLDQHIQNYKTPEKIHSKYMWCNQNYNKNVLLLVK